MTNKELLLIAELLDYAADIFSNRTCNDYSLPDTWSREEIRSLYKEHCECEGFQEDDDDEPYLGDDSLMRLFAWKIGKEINSKGIE
mgnify:FL=1